MKIIRSIDSFSLMELFKLIGNESRSGRAIVETPLSQKTAKREGIYYLWFQNGYLIAISNCFNQRGLIDLISARQWLNPAIASQLRKLCPTSVPLGIYLHKMKLLDRGKLNLIFQLQLHQVYRLFQLTEGRFSFEGSSSLAGKTLTLPWLEMTGHRIHTTEASLYALRLMANTDNFQDRLPPASQILRQIPTCSRLKLTTVERKIWHLADSKISLIDMAKIIGLPIATIRIVAFRLITLGLVETVFLPFFDWNITASHHHRVTLGN